MSQDLLTLFHKTIEDLKTNPRIEVVHLKWKPAMMNDEGVSYLKNFVEETFKEKLPDVFLVARVVSNNTHVCWRGTWRNKTYWGEFFLPSLLDLYRDPKIEIEQSFGGTLKSSRQLSIIDAHPEIGDIQSTLLDRSSPDLPLWSYYKGRAYAMNISYLEYLELLGTTRGIGPWPLHFASYTEDRDHADFLNERLAESREALRFFFPDANVDALGARSTP